MNFKRKCAILGIAVFLIQTFQVTAQSEEIFDGLTPYRTTNGSICVTPCQQRGWDYNWCYTQEKPTGWTDEHAGWGHCSPGLGVTYKGQTCQTNCEKYEGYYWCYVDQANHLWDYCGPTTETQGFPFVVQHKTVHGVPCISACANVGENYGWCYKVGGSWDYCSPKPGYDIFGLRCSSDCEYSGEDYTWCSLEVGGWDKCGQQSISSDTQHTFIGSKCLTPCQLDWDGEINKCYDATGENRECSRLEGLATNNMKCFSQCDYRGGNTGGSVSYDWCWTSEDLRSHWSTCSTVETDPEELDIHKRAPGRKKNLFPKNRIPLNYTKTGSVINIVTHKDDKGNCKVTFMEKLTREGAQAQYPIEGSELADCAASCLADWRRNTFQVLGRANTGRLAVSNHTLPGLGIRLDQQSRYTRNGVEYYNLQMQINGIRRIGRGQSTTCAEVQIQREVMNQNPQRAVDALLRSLYERYAVHVARFNYTRKFDENQPGTSNRNPHDELRL